MQTASSRKVHIERFTTILRQAIQYGESDSPVMYKFKTRPSGVPLKER